MESKFLSLRGWVVFIGTEAILAGVLWMIGLLNPSLLILTGVVLLALLWAWDNYPGKFPQGVAKMFGAVLPPDRGDISPIMLSVGESGPYMSVDPSIYTFRRILNLKIENVSRSQNVASCKIQIMDAQPPQHGNTPPWLFADGISLAAGDYKFVPLVSYGEVREPRKNPNYADTFAVFENNDPGFPTIDRDQPQTFKLRATSPDAAFTEICCQIWVSDEGRLRIEETS